MQRKSRFPIYPASQLGPLLAGAIAAGVFVVDTFTTLETAIAVLYVIVVLLAANVLQRRGILLVGSGCAALTVIGYLWSHGVSADSALARCLVSLFAIAVATVLALRNRAAATALYGQAQLLDLTHDAIFVRNMSDVITYWSRGAEELYGWRSEEAMGKSAHGLLQTHFPEARDAIATRLANADRWEGELVHTKKDGTQVPVASRWSLQRDRHGQPAAVLETNTDITERKRAAEEIEGAGRRLRATIDTIPAIVASYQADGTRDFVNRTWLDYAGMSREAARQSSWSMTVHPEDVEAARQRWSDCLATNQPFQMELRLLRADGEFRWHLVRRVPLRDDRGAVVKWYGVGFDIEDRKRAEAALRRSEAHAAEAQLLSRTGSFGWRLADGETTWSKETYRILGYDPTVRASVKLVFDRVHPDDLQLVEYQLERAKRGDHDFDFEHRVAMPDGQVKELRVRAHRITYEAGVEEVVGAVMDITGAKRAQEALHEAQAELAHASRVSTLGELTASIAHEVNQPLAGIVTNAEASLRWLAHAPPRVGEVRRSVERIIGNADRASGVIHRIRDLAKKAAPEMARLDINDVLEEALLLVQREALSNRVELRLALASDLPPVLGDRVQLQQVIINLAINGMEAMASINDRPRRLAIRSDLHEGDRVLVSVQDFGVGIDPENANRLFSAFYTTKAHGMGMGLSISRSIIEAHGGRIWATGDPGSGATLQFTLPTAAA
jgi:PAS domain S-box-containing protein